MRRLILSLVGSAAIVLGMASFATGSTVVRCRPSYCNQGPVVVQPPFGVGCIKAGHRLKLPTINVKSNAGIRSITIISDSRTIRTFHFKGKGPLKKVIRGLTINTTGLHTGLHTVTVVVKDTFGRTKRTVRRFTICPPPVFTG